MPTEVTTHSIATSPDTEHGIRNLNDAAIKNTTISAIATDNPSWGVQNQPALIVPPGWGFYWATIGGPPPWSDNKDNHTHRPYYGWDFKPGEQVLTSGRRAQLIGRAKISDFGPQYLWFKYEEALNWSLPGAKEYYGNDQKVTWAIQWYMNDRASGYGDNIGVANSEFVVFRIGTSIEERAAWSAQNPEPGGPSGDHSIEPSTKKTGGAGDTAKTKDN